MRVLSSKYGQCGNVEPMAGLAVQLGPLGAELRVWPPPDCAAVEQRDTPVANGVMRAGVCR
jgi:hypothetical protein